MSGPSETDWIWIVAGFALGIAGLALLLWALFWDRAKGRKRCPKCWYDMQGAEADTDGAYHCPECGRIIRHERKLRTTHRRKVHAVFAFLLFLAGLAIGLWPDVREDRWVRYLPDELLIRIFPLDETAWNIPRPFGRFWLPNERLCLELVSRMQGTTSFSTRQMGIVFDRMQRRPGTHLPKLLHVRSVWPRGHALRFYIEKNGALSNDQPWYVFAALSHDTSNEFITRSWGDSGKWCMLDTIPENTATLTIDYGIRFHESEDVWSGVTTPIKLVDSIDEVLTPVRTARLDLMIPKVVKRMIAVIPGHDVTPIRSLGSAQNDVTIALSIEILSRDIVVATGRLFYPISPFAKEFEEYLKHDDDYEERHLRWDMDALRQMCEDEFAEWRLVIRSDPDLALMDFHSDKYWNGEIVTEFDWTEIEHWCLANVLR